MLYITGDLHGNINRLNLLQDKLNKNDFLLITGDFGLVWDNSKVEKKWLNWVNNRDFITLFIDGNHENFELLENYPVQEWNGGKVHFVKDSLIHLMRGQVFTINEYKIFTFGGANSVDKHRRIKNISWWEREMPSTQEYEEGFKNLEKHNWEVDYIITHTCSSQLLDEIQKYTVFTLEPADSLNKYLQIIENEVKYKHWYCGHFHEDEIMDEKHTLLYRKIINVF